MTPRAKPISFIIDQVAIEFGCTREEIVGHNRGIIIDEVRRIAMYLARKILRPLDVSTPVLSKAFNRDHSTIVTVTNTFGTNLGKYPVGWTAKRVMDLEDHLREHLGLQINGKVVDLPAGQQPTVDASCAPLSGGNSEQQ